MNRLGWILCALGVAASVVVAADFKDNIALLRGYQDADEKAVLAAIEQLAASQDKRAIGPLSELLDISASHVRVSTAARQALLEMGALSVFSQRLKVGSLQDRQETARILAYMGSPALDLLLPLLSDPSPELRNSAVSALGVLARAIHDPKAVEGIIRALSDESSFVQESAVLALGNLGSPDGLQALANLVRQGLLVSQAAATFGKVSQSNAAAASSVLQALEPLWKDPGPEVVERAVQVLRAMQSPASRDPLIGLLKHEAPRIRFAALKALLFLKDDPAVRAAVGEVSTSDPDSLVKHTAASFLAGELQLDQ